MPILSVKHTEVEINGIRFEGFSEDSDAISVPTITLVSVRRGATGEKARFASGDQGGEFTFKLLPNSPTVPKLMRQAALIQQGRSINWEGSIRNTQTNTSASLSNGDLISYPAFYTMGKDDVGNMEFVFDFDILPDFDAPRIPIPAVEAPGV